jgi:hypothetical protein
VYGLSFRKKVKETLCLPNLILNYIQKFGNPNLFCLLKSKKKEKKEKWERQVELGNPTYSASTTC